MTITKIVSNLENNGSFLMKSIEMEFHGHSEICYESKPKELSNETTLVLSNTRELDRVPKTK